MTKVKRLLILPLILINGLFSQLSFAQNIELKKFGENPGNLKATFYAPKKKQPTLVVLLHGCAQHGDELAKQSGLSSLAEQYQFALLLPQQGLTNNIKRCFNWYSNEDYTKNSGENLSLKNMITTLKKQLGSEEIYIIGLSGGGAMASTMLVNYPSLFSGGAIVAGIPFPCANGLITGISCMRNGPSQTVQELVGLAEKINFNQERLPKISVWTGVADNIVNPVNSSKLAEQWALLSKITTAPFVIKKSDYKISSWKNNQQQVQVELVEVDNLGHGMMVNPNIESGGEVSDYLLAAPISTAQHLVKFWGL